MTDDPERHPRLVGAFQRGFRVWRASHAAVTPIASIIPGARARIEGIVEPGDAELVAPFTQRTGVLALVVLDEKQLGEGRRGGEIYTWQEQIRELSGVPFWIVDDAGTRAFVDPARAAVKLPLEDLREHPRVNDGNPQLDAYLRRHGVVPTEYMGIAGEHRFHEVVLAAGARVSVSGIPVRRSMHVPAHALLSYRDGPVDVPAFSDALDEPLVILPPQR